MMKKFKVLQELAKYGTDTKWVKDVREMALIDLLNAVLLQPSVHKKCNKVQHNKMRYA